VHGETSRDILSRVRHIKLFVKARQGTTNLSHFAGDVVHLALIIRQSGHATPNIVTFQVATQKVCSYVADNQLAKVMALVTKNSPIFHIPVMQDVLGPN
jgi:hypothetical protein